MDMLKVAEVLSHPERMLLLKELRRRDLTAHEASKILQSSASAASYHLRMMSEAGVIRSHRSDFDGRTMYYQYVPETVEAYLSSVERILLAPIDTPNAYPVVAFVCRANSARSQMAEAWARHFAPHLRIVSAGVEPSTINPLTREVMDEVGIDMAHHEAKQIVELDVSPDVVISVCDFARAHVERQFAHTIKYHWSIVDPAVAGTIQHFRIARDTLRTRVQYYMYQHGLLRTNE